MAVLSERQLGGNRDACIARGAAAHPYGSFHSGRLLGVHRDSPGTPAPTLRAKLWRTWTRPSRRAAPDSAVG
jgi:hypothetical protein